MSAAADTTIKRDGRFRSEDYEVRRPALPARPPAQLGPFAVTALSAARGIAGKEAPALRAGRPAPSPIPSRLALPPLQNDGYYGMLDKVLKQLNDEVPDAKYDKKTLAQLLWTMQQFMEDAMGKTVSSRPPPSAPGCTPAAPPCRRASS
jgi:hypothetical protein